MQNERDRDYLSVLKNKKRTKNWHVFWFYYFSPGGSQIVGGGGLQFICERRLAARPHPCLPMNRSPNFVCVNLFFSLVCRMARPQQQQLQLQRRQQQPLPVVVAVVPHRNIIIIIHIIINNNITCNKSNHQHRRTCYMRAKHRPRPRSSFTIISPRNPRGKRPTLTTPLAPSKEKSHAWHLLDAPRHSYLLRFLVITLDCTS